MVRAGIQAPEGPGCCCFSPTAYSPLTPNLWQEARAGARAPPRWLCDLERNTVFPWAPCPRRPVAG